ncbi:helix-turn-helix transcriptional regulator [Rhizobium sp. 1399]|uniref:helix-turn-helix domain-containing protein n=1 Tax=Rhizobium sp. 1399 TaxID=2817758 RepID=UPI00285828F8|nr:helix-turn-helix transcriptional regulator [Rhizobium sp. 1399]MDR6666390.1 transcriptional regulator with XRE-family HTH domain [Rhizobium sp. 1399]
MTISGAQCRAARGLIGWSQSDLCDAAKVGRATLANFEAEKTTPYDRTLRDIESALEAAGVRLIDGNYSGSGGPGVRLASPTGASIDVDESQTVQYEEHLTNDAPPGAGG